MVRVKVYSSKKRSKFIIRIFLFYYLSSSYAYVISNVYKLEFTDQKRYNKTILKSFNSHFCIIY